MKLLLDAHTLIWAADAPSKLGAAAARHISDPANERLVSAGSVWEIAVKVGLGKLQLSAAYLPWMEAALLQLNATVLPISVAHAAVYAQLPLHHRDPFDRLLVAQAQVENLQLISCDLGFDPYGVPRIW